MLPYSPKAEASKGPPYSLCAPQQDNRGIIFLCAGATKLVDCLHELENTAIVIGHEFGEVRAAELLVVAIHSLGYPVSIKQQTEITAERQSVLSKLAVKQAERHSGVGVEKAHTGSVAEQGPWVACAGEGESSARRIQHGINHCDVAAGEKIVQQHLVDAGKNLAGAAGQRRQRAHDSAGG